jgi:hypothetical protein
MYKQEHPPSRRKESATPEKEEDRLDFLESLLNSITPVITNRIPRPNTRRN